MKYSGIPLTWILMKHQNQLELEEFLIKFWLEELTKKKYSYYFAYFYIRNFKKKQNLIRSFTSAAPWNWRSTMYMKYAVIWDRVCVRIVFHVSHSIALRLKAKNKVKRLSSARWASCNSVLDQHFKWSFFAIKRQLHMYEPDIHKWSLLKAHTFFVLSMKI